MAKLNTKMGISMKTLTDKSTRNLAEMLTQGSGMGVVDCVKAQKDYPNAAPGAKRLAQRLQEFQEDSRVKLEQFLVKENPLRLTLFASSPEGRAIGKTENVSGMSKAPLSGSWQCEALTERVLFYSASTIAATILVAVATYSAMLNFSPPAPRGRPRRHYRSWRAG